MKIFALETDEAKVEEQFFGNGEKKLFTVRFHGFLFVTRLIAQGLVTLVLAAIAVVADLLGVPWYWVVPAFLVVWFFVVFFRVLQGYIDWRYDAILVTDRKVVIINQSSIFHVAVRQMHLENFASVGSSTQFLNLLPFGQLCFDLKEGVGQSMCLKYVPDAALVARQLSEVVDCYGRGTRPGAMQGGAVPPPAEA